MFEDLQKLLESESGGTLLALYLAFGLISVLAGAVGGALGAYLKQQAESLARAHSFDQLLDELRKTTALAEEIKTEVSHGVWLRQKAWEKRHEVYSAIVRHLSALDYQFRIHTDESGVIEASPRLLDEVDKRVGAVRDLQSDLAIHGSESARKVMDALGTAWNAAVMGDPAGNLTLAKGLIEAACDGLERVAREELGMRDVGADPPSTQAPTSTMASPHPSQ